MAEIQQKMFSQTIDSTDSTEISEEDSLRAKRRAKIIDDMLERLKVAVQKYAIQTEALCIEVEEFKGTRESLKADLQQTLTQEMARVTHKLTQELKSSIHLQITESLKTNVELIEQIEKEAEIASSVINKLTDQNKKRFIHWGLSLVASVCFSCFVMASCLFYFFPQQQYVRYEMNYEQAKQMLFGKSLLDNFKKLKQEDQKLLADAIEIAIKQMENGPAR